jgi:16S rRNA (cytosine967-C5)-methyltransferase
LRVNPLKTTRAVLKNLLGFSASETSFSPWGLSPEKFQGPPETWPGFAEGLFSIQDEASQILGLLLNSPGSVLDGCAGLGGKTTLIASLLPEARIVAIDPDGRKLSALGQEAARLGLKKAPETLKSTLQEAPLNGELFDLVVVDAPCSGLGVIRRRPDLKWAKKEADLLRHQAFQLELLTSAAEKAAKGGRLIYCVCTFAPEEGPEVMEKFLENSKGAFRLLEESEIPEALRPLLCQPGCLRLWTHRHGTDGFFYALLARV